MEQLIQAFLPIVVILFVVVGILSALVSTAAKTNEQMGNNREMSAYDRMLAEARARAASQREGGAASAPPPASGQKARLIAAPAPPANQPAAQPASRLQVKRRADAAPQTQAPTQAPPQRLREHHLEGSVRGPRDLNTVDDRNYDSLVVSHHLRSQINAPDLRNESNRARSSANALTQQSPESFRAAPQSPNQGRTLVDTSADTDPGALIHTPMIDFKQLASRLTPLQRVLVLGQILQSRPGEERRLWERY